jgi:hypothetical protein
MEIEKDIDVARADPPHPPEGEQCKEYKAVLIEVSCRKSRP